MSNPLVLLQRETVSIATYNCLANEFLHHWNGKLNSGQVAYTTQPLFDDRKLNDCMTRIKNLNADVLCIQELSASLSQKFNSQISALGYSGVYEQFDGKPDGIAIYYRTAKFTEARKEVLSYQDSTGRKAIFLHLKSQKNAIVDICNTHLQGGAQNRQVADQQIQKLVQKVSQFASPVVLCGDMNFTPADSRFQEMQKYLVDSLQGQSKPTSMNGTTALRLDYIWHSATLPLSSSQVVGELSHFLSPEEPSDHIPVVATFDIPVASTTSLLIVKNNQPGTNQAPSFRRKIFDSFNSQMQSSRFGQQAYEKYAAHFEEMIARAQIEDTKSRGQFLPHLIKEIAFNSEDSNEASLLISSISSVVITGPSNAYFNDQSFNNDPLSPWTLLNKLNDSIKQTLPNHSEIYKVLASQFSNFLTQADAIQKNQGYDFFSTLQKLIDSQTPKGFAKDLFLSVINSGIKSSETVIVVKCKDLPSGQPLFIRGSAAGLSWEHSIQLTPLDWETFQFKTNIPFNGELEFKLVLNNGSEHWEEGPNHRIIQGKMLEMQPAFNPALLPPVKKTVIEVDFPVPNEKKLYLSGSGPLGSWDRKVPMTCVGNDNRRWFLSFDGELPPFEYKLRQDDSWEQGPNRDAKFGEKQEIKSFQF